MSDYPVINWVTDGTDFNDYRPAIGPDGQSVIFERSSKSSSQAKLYMVNSLTGTPAPFLPNLAGPQTRPDWCWTTDMLAFNSTKVLRKMKATDTESTPISGTEHFIYPQWSTGGETLSVMNMSAGAVPKPCSSVIDPKSGAIVALNINGADANGTPVYGGMPAVNPNVGNLIAFAGQPALANWGTKSKSPVYNQNNNYIFLNFTVDFKNFSSSPMENGAPIDSYDPAFQGRAPAWSPNGQYVVFESTRSGFQSPQKGTPFALYLMDLNGSGGPVQLTDQSYEAQHAKFFPDGQNLIFCAKPAPTSSNAIAWIDISAYVS